MGGLADGGGEVSLAGLEDSASLAKPAAYASDLARGAVELIWLVELTLAVAEPEEVEV